MAPVRNGEDDIPTGDWISSYMAATDQLTTHSIYRLWSAITLVAGAIQRRTWIEFGAEPAYSSLYVMLVGRPSNGKSRALRPAKRMWQHARTPDGKAAFHVLPGNVTTAALLDRMQAAKDVDVLGGGEILEHHSGLLCIKEFSDFCSEARMDFLGAMTLMWDGEDDYSQYRRTGDRKLELINPTITMLAATQPVTLGRIMPEESWEQGFCSRLVLIYAPELEKGDPFPGRKPTGLELSLAQALGAMRQVHGEFIKTQAFEDEFRTWFFKGLPPVPSHPRLEHYNSRRDLLTIKLALASAVSRGAEHVVEVVDLHRAWSWLFEAELVMEHAFTEMGAAGSIRKVLLEINRKYLEVYATTRKGFTEAQIRSSVSKMVNSRDELTAWYSLRDQGLFEQDKLSGLWYPKQPEVPI